MDSIAGRLRDTLGGDYPVIAVSFADDVTDREIRGWSDAGLDVAELRIDWFASVEPGHVVKEVRRFAHLPTIATIRTAAEGGEWSGSDDERLALFRAVLPEVHGVDIELSSRSILEPVTTEARAHGATVVISHHDFEATPSLADLEELAAGARAAGADLVKIAVRDNSPEDIRTLAAFTLRNAPAGVIVVAMGAQGPLARVFFPALGSRLTFSRGGPPPGDAPRPIGAEPPRFAGGRAVPGQIGFAEQVELLGRFYPNYRSRRPAARKTGPERPAGQQPRELDIP